VFIKYKYSLIISVLLILFLAVFINTVTIEKGDFGDGSSAETFKLFDFHCHTLYGHTVDDLYDLLTDNGIIGCAFFPGFYGYEDENTTALHYDELLDAAKNYPNFFYPFAEVPRDILSPYPLNLEMEITDLSFN